MICVFLPEKGVYRFFDREPEGDEITVTMDSDMTKIVGALIGDYHHIDASIPEDFGRKRTVICHNNNSHDGILVIRLEKRAS